MSYGPHPWAQQHWDWRAAGNFIGGGAGGGLIVAATVAGLTGVALFAALIAGLALVGLGLACVWLEIGRPLRALNVFLNPRTSWMSRESIVAALLFASGGAALFVAPAFAWLAAALALVFVYCQSRIVRASRGIPAWRNPAIVPLMLATALAEGTGLACAIAAVLGTLNGKMLYVLAALLVARGYAWLVYLRRLPAGAPAHAPLEDAGRVLQGIGTLAPLALAAVVATGWAPDAVSAALPVAAGLMAAYAGSYLKFVIITRAGYNQGFALAHLPVRGARS